MASNQQFGGTELFAGVTPERLYHAAIDLDAVPQNIPDLVSHERVDATTLRAVVKPGVSFLRGTLKLEIKLDELQPPEAGVMRLFITGIGVTIRVESRMKVSAYDGGAQLDWQATVTEMKGLIATVSPTLVKATAEQTIVQGWVKLRERLGKNG